MILLLATVALAAGALILPRVVAERAASERMAVKRLVESVQLPTQARLRGCDVDAERCWVTPREGRRSLAGVPERFAHLGVASIRERCVPAPGPPGNQACRVVGQYRGHVIAIHSLPRLVEGERPIKFAGSYLFLVSAKSD